MANILDLLEPHSSFPHISAEQNCSPQEVQKYLYLKQKEKNKVFCLSRDFIQILTQKVTVRTERGRRKWSYFCLFTNTIL